MVLQEKPYWQKDDDKDSEPDTRPASHGYGPYGEPPRVEHPTPEPISEVRHHVPAAPLEGVISWRQNEDILKKASSEHSREEDDDDEEEDEQSTRTTLRPAPQKPTEQPEERKESAEHLIEGSETSADDLMLPPEHTLVAAEQALRVPEGAVAEAHTRHEKADDEDDTEDTDAVPPPHAARFSQPVQRPTTPTSTERVTTFDTDHQPADPQTTYFQQHPSYPAAQPAAESAPPRVAPVEHPTPWTAQTASEQPAPALAFTEAFAADPAAEAEPSHTQFEDPDVPPPHVGATEAADYQPAPPAALPIEIGDIPPTPPPNRPTPYYSQTPGMYPPTYAQQPAGAVSAPRFEHASAPVDNHRHGEPLAAAVGLGLVAEHIGRKHADTRQQNQIDRFTEQTSQYQQENNTQYARMQEQQRRFANEQQRQTDDMQRMHQQQQSQQERYAAAPATPYNLEYAPESAANTQPQAPQPFEAPAGNPLHRQYGAERMPYQQPPRQEAARPAPGQPGNAERQPDQQSEQEYLNEVQPQPKQHVEQSAWHRIVTEHGHEVQGAVQYGQEFHRQREHELLTDQSTANPSQDGAVGGGPGSAAPVAQQFPGQPMPGTPYQQPGRPGSLPSGMTNPTLPPGHPTHIDPQHQLPPAPRKQVASNIANPWFWIMLILIVAAFFTAALI